MECQIRNNTSWILKCRDQVVQTRSWNRFSEGLKFLHERCTGNEQVIQFETTEIDIDGDDSEERDETVVSTNTVELEEMIRLLRRMK